MNLDGELSHIKATYRQIFLEARTSLFTLLNGLHENFSCPDCTLTLAEPSSEAEILAPRHFGCGYRAWQQAAMGVIENQVARQVLERMNVIETYKQQFTCSQCGVCCRLASSEYSYEELELKASQGDAFAKQFTSIFLPYVSQEKASKKFPELVSSVLKQVEPGKTVYFYHCPYIGEDNRCTIYGSPKRPEICMSYPDTPLTFIYEHCAWKPWKEETHGDAMLAHALIELCSFTLGKLKSALT